MALLKEKSIDYRKQELKVKELSFFSGRVGNTVTQLTNRSTGVTINTAWGQITTNNTSLAAGAEASFVVTNNRVSATSVVILNAASGQTANTSIPIVTAVASGSFTIQLTNLHASTADTGAMVINFVVIGSD